MKSETTKPDLMGWLNETIERAAEDAADPGFDPHSYGSGYDKGYLAALKAVEGFLNGDVDG